MLRGTLLILLAMIPAAHGQSINKCKHPRTGAVAYSSSPCPSTEAEWKAEFEGTGDARDRDRMTAAQQVFKCVAGDEVAYQSAPCAAGQATEKAWEHGTYAPPDESYLQRIRQMEAASRQRDTQRRNASGPARSNSSRRGTGAAARGKSSIGRCDAAKAQRDRELYRLGPWRKIEDLRRRDPAVAEACKP